MSPASPAPSPSGGLSPAAMLSPAFLADPYALYAMLRRTQPVFRVPVPVDAGAGVFLLTRHAEVQHVLRDGAFSADRRRADVIERNRDALPADLLGDSSLFRSLLTMDPPDHTRVRGLVNKAFTPRRIAGLRGRIEALADELLAPYVARGGFDVISELAAPLPARVIAELLGVPAEDWPRFRVWAADLVAAGPGILGGEGPARFERGFRPLAAYLGEVIAARRREPRDDLVSALVTAQEERDALQDGELLATCVLLLVAGHETTTNLIGNGLLALLRHPEQLALLRAQPELVPQAVEEMLRYDGPVQATVRVAKEPVEVGGVAIAPGALVVCGIGAANRDPAVFLEPDRFDVTRRENHHLAFGFGAHFCLGAPLARLEGELAFRALLERFPRLTLASESVRWRPNPVLRGLLELPVHA